MGLSLRLFAPHIYAVAILELKKWGGHCGAKEKVGGPTKLSTAYV